MSIDLSVRLENNITRLQAEFVYMHFITSAVISCKINPLEEVNIGGLIFKPNVKAYSVT